ncbi:hypothetical protein D9615_005762 [Tricholomella constricta]|uniref:Uncharacterized protein n=1 Tax=Tricholomella constricta TaxID=117010 RepID=A0A8H5HAX3_9AGAR|nr:hypothetical protein D9615_005762 [Tricholomella constricta]
MATILERPMSALSDAPVVPQQRRRPSIVEVIDVDLLDDPTPSTSSRPTSRPTGRTQPETILLLDSDDEDPAQLGSSGSSSARPDQRRQRLTSPPPPASAGPSQIPPVPRIPRRYSGLASYIAPRRLPPDASPPVVRPIDQPFEFEANLRSSPPAPGSAALHVHPNRHRRVPYVEVRTNHQARHVPSLGLGGAIISLNRARADDLHEMRRERHRHLLHNNTNIGAEAPGFLARAGNTMRRIYTTFARGNDNDMDDDEYPEMQMMLAHDLGLDVGLIDRFDHPARGFALQEMLFRSRENRQRHLEAEYKAEYTHPGQPESGFTFDFTQPDPEPVLSRPAPIIIDLEADSDDTPVAGPSTKPAPPSPVSKVHTLLVCARCLDPLVLGGGLVGDERQKKKVWALRCGHMIDGKCLGVVGVPEEPNPESERRADSSGKGKGKARADVASFEIAPPPANTIRSRLRSRAPPPAAAPVASSSTSAPAAAPPSTSPTILGKRKRASHAKPRIEAIHEWKCPVPGCERVHASVKIGGAWTPEPVIGSGGKGKGKTKMVPEVTAGRGAIAVFV